MTMLWNIKKFRREQLALRQLRHADSQLSPLVAEQVFTRVMQAVHSAQPQPAGSFTRPSRGWVTAVYGVLSALLGTAVLVGTAFASTSAMPGDTLYPVKLAQERVRLTLAATEASKARLKTQFARERITEFKKMSAAATPSVKTQNPGVFSAAEKAEIPASPALRPQVEQAKKSADASVRSAIADLKKTEEGFRRKGNAKDAEEIRQSILQLRQEARQQRLMQDEDENGD